VRAGGAQRQRGTTPLKDRSGGDAGCPRSVCVLRSAGWRFSPAPRRALRLF